MKKRGISPVIATVLLIAIVIVIALIIALWMRSITKEAIVKFDENIELVCEEIQFDASYSGGKIQITNDGTVPISNIKLKIFSAGSHSTEDLNSESDWNGLMQGSAYSTDYSIDSDATKIVFIPVLRGISDSGHKDFVCDESYGVEKIL